MVASTGISREAKKMTSIFRKMKSDVAEQLRLLALVREHGTLAGAGAALRLTGAAVTQRIAKAEADWGVPLVERTTRGARLTPAAEVLADHGLAVQAQVEAARSAFAEQVDDRARRLRIGAFHADALHLLPPAMTALRHRSPEVEVSVREIQSSQALDLVAAGELDVAVMASWDDPPEPLPHTRIDTLAEDPLVLVAPADHRVARTSERRRVRLASLADEVWVVIRAGVAARGQFDRVTADAGFVPEVRFESESYDVAQALVETGYGVALVSGLARRPLDGTVARRVDDRSARRTLHLVTPEHPAAPGLVEDAAGLLRSVAADLLER